jgi:hypothetical protein
MLTTPPSPNGSNGDEHDTDAIVRNSSGRFTAGNPGGPGNPWAKQTAELRALIRSAVTDQDMQEVMAAIVRKAKAGDVVAGRELLDRLVGKASQKLEMDVQTTISSEQEERMDRVQEAIRLDLLYALSPGLLECAVNEGKVKPKEARRAERIKAFMEQSRKEMEAEPDEPPGSGKYGAWRQRGGPVVALPPATLI